jgi:hypothetical protein
LHHDSERRCLMLLAVDIGNTSITSDCIKATSLARAGG